jgi:hypothetical protein
MAALAERLAALTFKVKGTIEKDQLTLLEEGFLIIGATV